MPSAIVAMPMTTEQVAIVVRNRSHRDMIE